MRQPEPNPIQNGRYVPRPNQQHRLARRNLAFGVIGLLLFCATPGFAQKDTTFQDPNGRVFGMGLEPTPPAVRARSARFVSKMKGRGDLPSRVVLTEWLPPVGNQGGHGSCASWAAGYYCYSYSVAKQRKLTPEQRVSPRYLFSPAFLFHQHNKGENKGTSMPVIFNLLAQKGCASLAEMPYSDQDLTSQPSPEAFARADKYKSRYAGLLAEEDKVNLQVLKMWLAEVQTPLVFAIPIHTDFPSKADGDFVYTNATDKVRGYHAITCVGYDEEKKAFRLVNSWGAGWADKGFLWVSEAFVQNELIEAWGQTAGGVVARDPTKPMKVSASFDLVPAPAAAGGTKLMPRVIKSRNSLKRKKS